MKRNIDRPDALPLNEVFGLNFAQADVDFVIPNLADDTRLAIDPFLLFKSRNAEYRQAHDRLLAVFNDAIQKYAAGQKDEAARLLDFPEVDEIGFGYKYGNGHGAGLGKYLSNLLLKTLGDSPALVSRGVRHIEEMQLVTLGINADRVSDITANLLKSFLIEYTQRQAETYGIPLTKGVPVSHVFDYEDNDWRDDYFDLPVNPIDPYRRGIILVPRRIVRKLPWINFSDYQRAEFGLFLRASRSRLATGTQRREIPSKEEVVAVSRREVERIDHYIDTKERDAKGADPELLITATPALKELCNELIAELKSLAPGHKDAYKYQDLMLRILNVLFSPELTEGRKQERTEHGTEIRDIVFVNESDKPFWEHIRDQYRSLTIVFECKNTDDVQIKDIDQLASYLGDAMGYFGVFLTRQPLAEERRLKCLAWYNKGFPRRTMVAICDADVERMLLMRASGNNPAEVVRNRYREFVAKAQ